MPRNNHRESPGLLIFDLVLVVLFLLACCVSGQQITKRLAVTPPAQHHQLGRP